MSKKYKCVRMFFPLCNISGVLPISTVALSKGDLLLAVTRSTSNQFTLLKLGISDVMQINNFRYVKLYFHLAGYVDYKSG